MPNWCDNSLQIWGPAKDVKKCRAAMKSKESDFDFDKIHPLPKALKGTTAPTPKGEEEQAKKFIKLYGAPDWYEWQIKNWGTKWNIDPSSLVVQPDGPQNVRYNFSTAWSPPEKIVACLADKFRTLSFKLEYCEPGCAFAGVLEVERGKVVDRACYEPGMRGYEKLARAFGMWDDEEPEEKYG